MSNGTNPYSHHREQEQLPINGEIPDNQGGAARVITQWKREIHVYRTAGEWLVNKNDGSPVEVIAGAYYDPLFYVKGFKFYIDADTTFARCVYDTPKSTVCAGVWATGVVHPGQITRLWTSNALMPAILHVSLLG